MTTQSSVSGQPDKLPIPPKQRSVNQAFSCLGIGVAIGLNLFTYVAAFFLIASGFDVSRDIGLLIIALVVLAFLLVYRIHRLIKNPGINITINGELRPIDNLYPVYLLLILFILIQALIWVTNPDGGNHEPRSYFMTLVSGALIYFSNGIRNNSNPVITPSKETGIQ